MSNTLLTKRSVYRYYDDDNNLESEQIEIIEDYGDGVKVKTQRDTSYVYDDNGNIIIIEEISSINNEVKEVK